MPICCHDELNNDIRMTVGVNWTCSVGHVL